GIENYWIYLLLQLGILKFVPFALALLWFLGWLARGRGLYVGLATLSFLVTSSGNNSLSSKTTAVGALVILVIGAAARHDLVMTRDRGWFGGDRRPARAHPGAHLRNE